MTNISSSLICKNKIVTEKSIRRKLQCVGVCTWKVDLLAVFTANKTSLHCANDRNRKWPSRMTSAQSERIRVMKSCDKQPLRRLAASTEDFSRGRDEPTPPQIKHPQPECKKGPLCALIFCTNNQLSLCIERERRVNIQIRKDNLLGVSWSFFSV